MQELARLGDAHDLTDFEGQLEEVTEPVFERQTVIPLNLGSTEAEAVKKTAKAKGVAERTPSKLGARTLPGRPATYSKRRNVYILPREPEAWVEPIAPGGRKPYSPAPRFGRVSAKVRLTIFLPSNGTTSRIAPPEA